MKFILFALLLIGYTATAQQKKMYTLADTPIQIDSTTGGMIYTEVVPVDSATQEQLYLRAKTFLLKAFTNESAVTQMDDKINGVVGGRGKFVQTMGAGTMLLTGIQQVYYEMAVEVRVKPGRYRYEFSNMEIVGPTYRVRVDEQMRKHPEQTKKTMYKPFNQRQYDNYMSDKNPVMVLIRQLKQTMNPPKGKDKNDF